MTLQDYDRDGLLDRYERQVSLSNPENEDTDGDGKNDGDEVINYKTSPLVGIPNVADITIDDTVVTGSVPLKTGAATQTAKVINSSGNVIGTSTVNVDGTFSVTIPKSTEGTYTIAIDSPNYDNDEVNTFEIVDLSKVPTPTIDPVDDNDTKVVINGTANATITVKDQDNNVIGTVTIPADGSAASIQLDQPLKAGTVLTSTASKNGKTSEVSAQVVVTDATAPEVPIVNDVTSEDTTISGTAEPGSTVTVTFPDDTTATGTTGEDGNYTIDIPSNVDLTGGEALLVTATDGDANESEPATVTVIDTTAPEAPTVNPITIDDTTISGTAESGSTVKVTFPDGSTGEGTTDEAGNYTIDIPSNVDLTGGETLPVTSTDADGNESEAATVPTVNPITSGDTTISGTAEPGSTVTVTFPDGTTATGTTDEEGNYTIEIPGHVHLQPGDTVTVTATDKDGNTSNPTHIDVQPGHENINHGDNTGSNNNGANNNPVINPIDSKHQVISGQNSTPGNTVEVTFPSGTTTTTVHLDGNWEVPKPSSVNLNDGQRVSVVEKDSNGNTIDTTTENVVNQNKQNINKGDHSVKEDLPETGETSTNNATILGSLFAAIGALLLFVKRRRKKKKKIKSNVYLVNSYFA
ncbi:TPA: Ig-like domain-containing protein [Staphylococcus pseudintermedius]